MTALGSTALGPAPTLSNIPRSYNAAHDLLRRNLDGQRGNKVAYVDDRTQITYSQLAERVDRFANSLDTLGVQMEQRLLLCMHDSIDWPTVFLGCIKAGVLPVAVNTSLTSADYDYMLRDSRAKVLVVSAPLLAAFEPLLAGQPYLRHVIVSGSPSGAYLDLGSLLAAARATRDVAPTLRDDMCFWLYSSGSTGPPKGTVHVHASLIRTAELYGCSTLGIRGEDVVFSAPKLFFAYGLGNALTFPLMVGATTILMSERPTPDAVLSRLERYQPTIFYGVPTLYAALLASGRLPPRGSSRLRACISAGEALPKDIGDRWFRHFGVDILDGIGSTEMLHIFLSNRPGDVRYGTSGKPVPGYLVRVVDENGTPAPPGVIGELQICGPTSAMTYWNNREKTLQTFEGRWTHSGDKYFIDSEGYYIYAGRSDDMLKVSGMYVSPVEVESTLITHPAVLEAAVVGKADDDQLTKPCAYVVLNEGFAPSTALIDDLKIHVKSHLAPFKYPRWIEFVPELPKTATGKIQRYKLRERATHVGAVDRDVHLNQPS